MQEVCYSISVAHLLLMNQFLLLQYNAYSMTNFIFVIDVSGNPYQNTYISLVSVIDNYHRIVKDFRFQFPDACRQKGSDLKEHKLKSIVSFLSDNGVLMRSMAFSNTDWNYYRQKYGNNAYFKEKIFSVIYFMLLENVSSHNKSYRVTVDKENFMNIDKVLESCKKIARANKYFFNFNVSHIKLDELIKFADYTASAHRKVDVNHLKLIRNLRFINSTLSGLYLKKVFGP